MFLNRSQDPKRGEVAPGSRFEIRRSEPVPRRSGGAASSSRPAPRWLSCWPDARRVRRAAAPRRPVRPAKKTLSSPTPVSRATTRSTSTRSRRRRIGGIGTIYEPLFFINKAKVTDPVPLLGTEYSWNADGTELS